MIRRPCHLSAILSMMTGTSAVATVTMAYRTSGLGMILVSRRAVRRLTRAAVTERRIGNVDGVESPDENARAVPNGE